MAPPPHPCPQFCYAAVVVMRRTVLVIIARVMPLKSMLTPTITPTAHTLLFGQFAQIKNAKIIVMMPSTRIQPAPLSLRSWYDNANSRIASTKR